MPLRSRRNNPTENAPQPQRRPWEHGESDGGSFGSWLRQQREIRNITLREISDSTKIGMRYLEALEEDRFDVLPAGVFARGFLREYAKYVGLDADEVVNFYLAAEQDRRVAAGESEIEPEPEVAATSWRPSRRGLLVALGAALAVLLLVWAADRLRERGRAAEQTAPPIAPPVPELAPVPTVEQPPRPASEDQDLVVTLGFTDECWVEAVVDGQRRISELRVQGESMQIEARERVVLTVGNVTAVRIEVNGKPLPLDAPPGRVLRDLTIDRRTAGLPPLEDQDPAPGARRPGGSR
jgi:cytoskeleton protein RodZ